MTYRILQRQTLEKRLLSNLTLTLDGLIFQPFCATSYKQVNQENRGKQMDAQTKYPRQPYGNMNIIIRRRKLTLLSLKM